MRRLNRLTSPLLALGLLLAACSVPLAPWGTPAGTQSAATRRPSATAWVTPTRRPSPSATPLPSPSPTPTQPPHLLLEPAALRGVRVRFWHPWSGVTANEVRTLAQEFSSTNKYGIQVEALEMGGEEALWDALFGPESGDDLPSLLAFPASRLFALRSHGLPFANLNEYAASQDWGLPAETSGGIPRPLWEQGLDGDFRLAAPLSAGPQVLYYNLTWGRELGFNQPPASLEDFRAQACAAAGALLEDKERANDGSGGWLASSDPLVTLSFAAALDNRVLQGLDNETLVFNAEPFTRVFDTLRGMAAGGCAFTSAEASPYALFAGRQALFYSGSAADAIPQLAAFQAAGSADEWGMLAYPSDGAKPVVIAGGPSLALLQSTPAEQLAAWLFLRRLLEPDAQARLARAAGWSPVAFAARQELGAVQELYPQWAKAWDLTPFFQSAPRRPSWLVVGPILEDAAWQLFRLEPTPIAPAEILDQLDQTIPDVLNRQ